MESELLHKIQKTLAGGISSECKVVYLLVEIRKLLDREKGSGALYSSLRLYCNWVVHIELSRGQAQNTVRLADSIYSKLSHSIPISEEEKTNFHSLFSLETFREDLNQFLVDHKLDVFTETRWNVFPAHFLNVIQDCPLVFRAPQAGVKDVEVLLTREVGEGSRTADGTPPPILWVLTSGGNPQFMFGQNITLSDPLIGPAP
jgi:hypothetical protein